MPTLVRALVEGAPQQGVTDAAQTTIGGTAAAACAYNAKRKGLIIQNTGTHALYFAYGTTDPTTTVYHFALKACDSANDGTGGVWIDDSWIGPVRVISAGGGGTYVLTEIQADGPPWDLNADWGNQFGPWP